MDSFGGIVDEMAAPRLAQPREATQSLMRFCVSRLLFRSCSAPPRCRSRICLKLGRGAVVPLDHRVGEPVDVVVNGRVVARGEVVVVEDDTSRFGVSLTEVIGADHGQRELSNVCRSRRTVRRAGSQASCGAGEGRGACFLRWARPLASRLLKHFDQDELREITRAVAESGRRSDAGH